jgi:hypothetical protein
LAVGGNNGGAGGAKNLAKAQKKPRVVKKATPVPGQTGAGSGPSPASKPRIVKAAGPPNFPKLVPVRPGAPTPKGATKPSTQAQRTHVHKVRAQRAKLIQQKPNFPTATKSLPHKRKQKASDIYLTDPAALKAAGFKAPGLLDKIAQSPGEFTANAFKDAAELAATTPTSTYLLGKTAVTDPKKLPGMLAEPYKQLITDPSLAFKRPVSTALMFAPAGKLPGLAAGKVARLAGAQTLKGEVRTLPGTALKQETRLSKDAFKNAQQARQQRARPTPTITDKEIRRRVDEHFEYRRKHTRRVEASKSRELKPEIKVLPKAERPEFVAEELKGARGGAGVQNDRTFVKEFGSHWQVHRPGFTPAQRKARITELEGLRNSLAKKAEGQRQSGQFEFGLGNEANVNRMVADVEKELQELHAGRGENPSAPSVVVKPKDAAEGHLHSSREDALKVVERLKAAGHGEFAVKPVGESQFGVVPKVAAKQLQRHQVVGSSSATYAKVLRASRQKFTNAVLPLSPKWLTGQLVEGTLRAVAHGAGPTSLLRERRVFKALEKQRPGAGKEFRQRGLPGGHYGGQIQEFRKTPLHELFSEAEDGKLGAALAKAGRAGEKTPGAKQVVKRWNQYTSAVFDQVNGRFIENTQQRAMLGRSLKDSPLMERKLVGLSKKAAQEAAQGLRGTETQVAFGRAVERAYGRYSNFSPTQRERNLHWTPFLPWYANAVKFLTQVLPKDHPVLTSLLAAGNVATQKEREKQGLSTLMKGGKPLFMQGGVATKAGGVVRIGHYTPFGIASSKPSESVADLVLPQLSGGYKNLLGIDWKGEPLKKGGGFYAKDFSEPETWARALSTEAEALVPGAGQIARVTGAEDALAGKKDAQTVLSGKDLKAALRKEVDPFMATAPAKPKKKKKALRKKKGGSLFDDHPASGGHKSLFD